MSNNQILIKQVVEQERNETTPNMSLDSFFEIFSISQVLKNFDLNNEEIENNITDGEHDGGCDGIFVFVNNELLTEDKFTKLNDLKGVNLTLIIFQVKQSNGFQEPALMKWKTIVQNLMNLDKNLDDYRSRYSDAVISHFRLFRDAVSKYIRYQLKINVQFYYITYSTEIHPSVNGQAEELEQTIHELYPSSKAKVNFIGADALMDMYNSPKNSVVNLPLADTPISLGSKNEFVALVSLKEYFRFITDEQGNLRHNFFEGNVRDYQGHNYVNKSIADTLNKKDCLKGDFWWLNNGVTILAEQITPVTIKELEITNPEIVNGLQTSTEIYNYFSENKNSTLIENRNLLVRLIVPDDESSRDSIIYATNNQTNISKSYLRVTDTIHLQIELFFKSRGIYYERRKNYYKNQKKKSKDIISVSFLAQCMITIFLQQPDQARARPSTLLTDDNTYKELYKNNQDLEVFYIAASLGIKIRDFLKQINSISSPERNDVLFYVLYGVVATAIGKKKILFNDLKNIDLNSIDDEYINNIYQKIFTKYKDLGGDGRVAKSTNFITEVDSAIFSNGDDN